MKKQLFLPTLLVFYFLIGNAQQKKDNQTQIVKHPFDDASTYSAFKFRNIGPAVTSGRIVDIVVNPNNPFQWYIAVASGGIWKTDNAGTSFYPIFDTQGSYSIGCLTMDPNNQHVIWAGTGENNNQRSVGYGDGVYKSEDGGKTWQHMGLKNSEHIGMIAIDPRNSNTVFVAAYGPLWKSGGERGLYKSTNGGKNWKNVLHVSEQTGINEVHIDPSRPDIMYATAHQRRRHEWTYISGGPESAIYKSTDGGETWNKLTNGLPKGDVGRIGMAISPVNPDYVYACIEATDEEKGFYRSTDRGASWEKRSSHSTAGNYYVEIFADPVNLNKIYSMDTWAQVTEDGGKTFRSVGEKNKHVDNHALWIDPKAPHHLLMGCDGGLYETWDGAKTWNYKPNLPVTQFYRVAVDNSTPFYYVYGGTQDNNTLGGPSRTTSASGITNADWFVTVGGDGFEPAIDPYNTDIVYSQWQYGGLIRYDRKTGEALDIKPQEKPGEAAYRFNWDAPLLISRHDPKRIYFAAQKIFRSDDRGENWKVISDDLSRKIDRNKMEVMGRVWSMDAIAKNQSTTIYGTITALAESPLDENLLFAGTDDGMFYLTKDGGSNWEEFSSIPGIPQIKAGNVITGVLIPQIVASRHDRNTVYVIFNNHRWGDFIPYIMKSTDLGKTWINIGTGLPQRGSVYTLAEDHINKNLLFAGTEFGLYFTLNGGKSWLELKNGLPTICIRDIAIQERENDLVLASFGRGFFILDDYSPLQSLQKEDLEKPAHIFPIKDGLLFHPSTPYGHKGKSFQGESFYMADNPPVGATITYYLKDDYKTLKEKRKEAEKERIKNNLPIYYPSLDSIRLEDQEEAPILWVVIKDLQGNLIRRLKQPAKKGLVRITWNGRHEATSPVSFIQPNPDNPYENEDQGPLAIPGTYTVQLELQQNGNMQPLTEPVKFIIKPLIEPTLVADKNRLQEFNKNLAEVRRIVLGTNNYLGEMENRMKYIGTAITQTVANNDELLKKAATVNEKIKDLQIKMNGDKSIARREFETLPGITGMIENMVWNLWSTSAQPTGTYENKLKEVKEKFDTVYKEIIIVKEMIEEIEKQLENMKAPHTPGRLPEWK
ncbi:MAG: glycosyl hydrolase [Flavobacteriales bacterium]|nr:glycosyl hydrolase [Flavobacteriales bacterium]